jgi:alkylation response protein AidB-like acyl-CoA dehydrogenase
VIGRARMDFDLPDDLREIQRTVREFVQAEVKPHAREWDERAEFPWPVVRKLGPLGLMGISVPEAYGGAGMGALGAAVIMEEIARGDGSLALTVGSHNGLGTRSSRPGGSPSPAPAPTRPAWRRPRCGTATAGS